MNSDTLVSLINTHIADRPTQVALRQLDVHGQPVLVVSYAQLGLWVEHLAGCLAEHDVVPGTRVALDASRTPATVAMMIAIAKLGGIYVPVDFSEPRERLKRLVELSHCGLVVAFEQHIDIASACGAQVYCLRQEPSVPVGSVALPEVHSSDPAYILFTSGSTGEPKPVLVPHSGITRLVHPDNTYCEFSEHTHFLQISPLTFDASTLEIWGPLLNGGCCTILPFVGLPDPQVINEVIERDAINSLFLTTSLFHWVADSEKLTSRSLRYVIAGGEALSPAHARKMQAGLPNAHIVNGYGPTECTTFTACYVLPKTLPDNTQAIPIGYPIVDTQVLILDEHLNIAPEGQLGQLAVAGSGLALEYCNNPEATQKAFVEVANQRVYLTGDRVQQDADGLLRYQGRIDDQVKIAGHRIELNEINSHAASITGVGQAYALVSEFSAGAKQLILFVTTIDSTLTQAAIAEQLATVLPEFMRPNKIVCLNQIPVNQNGKVDKKSLLALLETNKPISAAQTTKEKLTQLWCEIINTEQVQPHDHFFQVGGSSLLCMAMLKRARDYQLPMQVLDVFEHPVFSDLLNVLEQRLSQPQIKAVAKVEASSQLGPIAVIGMSGRFPGANTVEEFWQHLVDGNDTLTHFSIEQLDPSQQRLAQEDGYVPVRGIVQDSDCFDAGFFGFSSKEAELADPQLRIFLEEAWHALEHAGYFPEEGNRIGVFAGSGYNGYYAEHVLATYGQHSPLGLLPTQMLNDKDYLATQTAYRLNLQGPCLSINTACSTSLVAIAEAVKSLRMGESEMALAGGVSLQTPTHCGYTYQEGSMLSCDGKTRPFSEGSTGTVFNSGVGVVVLKPLAQAQLDGDTIYSVIHGIGLNNDGANKASFTAPSVEGQTLSVTRAIRDAGFDSASIDFIEAHGTATPLGDPIEVKALHRAFLATCQQERQAPCYIGSVKSNCGHLVSAAGVTGFIKASLAMHHRFLPKNLHFSKPNPHLQLEQTPFSVCSEAVSFEKNSRLRAGVSSFGVGGTNAHVVLESFSIEQTRPAPRPTLFTLSAKQAVALAPMAEQLRTYLNQQAPSLVDASFTTQQSRSAFAHRQFFTADENGGLSLVSPIVNQQTVQAKACVFMCSGQGSQVTNMGRQHYFYQPVFRAAVDQCVALFNQHLSVDIFSLIFSDEPKAQLHQTEFTQPALFIIEYATAKLWQALGLQPVALIGHSIGEYVAAVLAEVFTLEDAIAIVAKRGQLMQSMPVGVMLSVRTSEVLSEPLLENCEIAVYNGEALLAVSGTEEDIAALESRLDAQAIEHSRINASHGFHSKSMAPAAAELTKFISTFERKPPKIAIASTCTGQWLSDEDATSAEYWGRQLREPVRFVSALNTLKEAHESVLLLETGPGKVLVRLAQMSGLGEQQVSLASGLDGGEHQYQQWLTSVGRCWQLGLPIHWEALQPMLDENERRAGRIPLPTYPFEKKRYWLPMPGAQTQPIATIEPLMEPTMSVKQQVINHIKELCLELSGEDVSLAPDDMEFLELGMDSLVLTQVALKIKNHYKVDVPFRRLMQDLGSFASLSEHLVNEASPESLPQAQVASVAAPMATMVAQPLAMPTMPMMNSAGGNMQSLIAQQLALLSQQLSLLTGQPVASQPMAQVSTPASVVQTPQATDEPQAKKTFGAQTKIKIDKSETQLTAQQQQAINDCYARYIEKTKASKEYAQAHRAILADPRTASGFTPETKEQTYPIVVKKSHGCRFIDLDDNEYIDVLCGYGSNFFGYSPKAITQAMKDQLDTGIEIGPQTPLAGEVAKMLAEVIPLDRFAFCNTGSEAVLGAMRMARTASGRSKIVMFNGAYHGIVDEVIVREGRNHKGLPAAAGIMPSGTENIIMLDYGSDEALKVIEQQKDDIAGVLIEPVQSRNPDLQPKEFLHKLRKLTQTHEIAFIMDEVITGFRTGIGGAQAYFGVKADIASYGKVIGGGVSLGIIGGIKRYMDTLDGGFWQYGDDSVPEVGVTYFAGTFVRHPLALAAAKAVLIELKEQGPQLQQRVNEAAEDFARDLNLYFKYNNLAIHIGQFSSLMYFKFTEELPHGELIFNEMRINGIHIWYGRPMFFTAAHTAEDIATVKQAFIAAIEKVQSMGFNLKTSEEK